MSMHVLTPDPTGPGRGYVQTSVRPLQASSTVWLGWFNLIALVDELF